MSTVSVLMATYNGEKYIEEQLESLRQQEQKIDEVIIIDDDSTDETAKIVTDFIKRYTLSGWRLIKNDSNRGWKNNFMNGLQQCTGDYIFTCDQDDIWEPFKIKEMSAILDEKEEILLLASNYKAFYQKDGKTVKETMMPDTGEIYHYPLDEQVLFVKRPGCVYAIRKRVVDYIKEYAFDNYPHDAFVWRVAMLLDGLYIYNRMTIRYRRHEQTATGRDKKTGIYKLNSLTYYQKVLKSMIRFVNSETDVQEKEEKLKYIKAAEQWCVYREKALKNADVIAWLKLMKYHKYYYNKKSWFADFLMLGDYKKENR